MSSYQGLWEHLFPHMAEWCRQQQREIIDVDYVDLSDELTSETETVKQIE